jgi:ABC-2 type transport system ATP-binding protein
MTARHEPLVRALGVTRRFGAFTAVEDVGVHLYPGEVVGLLGANGAGKTTLIRMLLGLLHPSEGEVSLFGESPSRRTRRRMGYVPQGLGLYDDLTASENLEFVRAAFGPRPDAGSGAGRAEHGAVREAGDVPVGRLPLGIQRRVAFAEALDHHPDLLVLDEPTSGVDPLARARLWETLRTSAEAGTGVLVTTHHMEEAEECDRLVIMTAGRVVAQGTVEEITGEATVTAVHTEAWAEAFDLLEGAGLSVALAGRSLHLPGATTDQVDRALDGLTAEARVEQVPVTLEESFFQLATGPASSDDESVTVSAVGKVVRP